jgi:hypothetical protein
MTHAHDVSRLQRIRTLVLAPRSLDCVLVAAVIGLAIATRLYGLGSESIWLDEAITFIRSNLPLDKLLKDTITRHHTPTYFLLMHYWLQLGDDEMMLRLPSAIFAILAAIASVVLGAVVGGLRVGAFSCMLFALAPQLLRYSQEARMYAMYFLFTTSGMCGLLWLVKHADAAALWPFGAPAGADGDETRHARRAWLTFILSTIAVLYVHNTAVLFWAACWAVAGAMFLALPGRRKPFLRNWLLANAAVLLLWSPWVRILLVQAKEIDEHFWASFPTRGMILSTLQDLYLLGAGRPLPALLVAAAALVGVWSLRKQRLLLLALLMLSVAAPAMILVISLHRPIFLPRLMLWGSVPFFVLAACGIDALRPKLLIAVVAAAILASGASNLDRDYYTGTRKPRWEEAIRYLIAEQEGTGRTLMIGGREKKPLLYYAKRHTRPLPDLHADWVLPEGLDRWLAGQGHTWFISATERKGASKILRMMSTRGHLVRRKYFGHGLNVYEYRVRLPKSDG